MTRTGTRLGLMFLGYAAGVLAASVLFGLLAYWFFITAITAYLGDWGSPG